MIELLIQHQFWAAVVIYWIFSAAVSAMPDPGTNAGPGYLWLYRFVHTIAGNLTTAFGNRIPGLKILVVLLLVAGPFDSGLRSTLQDPSRSAERDGLGGLRHATHR